MKYLNTVTRISKLGKDIPDRVRAKEPGLFKDTIIREGDIAYGYDRSGKCYQFDADDIPDVARFLWHQDKTGHVVTSSVVDREGNPLRLDGLIMGAWTV